MADPTPDDRVTQLEDQLFVAESVVAEFRKALADSQFALAKSNAQLKLANKPTA